MTNIHTCEGAPAPSNLLAFPTRNKGRIRKSNSPEAMGRCSIALLERDGEAIPSNVTDLRSARSAPEVDFGRLALRLALQIFETLGAEQKARIRNTVRAFARHDDGNIGDECRPLYPLLTGEGLPC